jgi:acyl dehydratase
VRTFNSPDEVVAAVGEQLGRSAWLLIDQTRIDLFDDAVGSPFLEATSRPESALRQPGATTGAPSYLAVTLVPMFLREVVTFPFRTMGVNYGLNRVRFPAALVPGSLVRGVVELVSAEPMPGCLQVVTRVTLEVQGSSDPVCIAEPVTRHYL